VNVRIDLQSYKVPIFLSLLQAEARKQEAEAGLEQLLNRLDTAVAAVSELGYVCVLVNPQCMKRRQGWSSC